MRPRSSFRDRGARRRWAQLSALAFILWSPSNLRAAPPQALWHVVHDLCVVNRKLTGHSAPCLEVNLREGYAVVPDPKERSHLLLVPTRHIAGIEDPRVVKPETPNYWQQAWVARARLAARLGRELPRGDVGLAINAISGRSQDQLHIHISCVQPLMIEALQKMRSHLGDAWSPQEVLGRQWQVRTLRGYDLNGVNPFELVARSSEAAARDMGDESIVVLGAQFKSGPGFYILARSTEADTGEGGTAEYMLDESCAASGVQRSGGTEKGGR